MPQLTDITTCYAYPIILCLIQRWAEKVKKT